MHTTQSAKNRSHEYAIQMDNLDKLKHIRQEFIIPSKDDLKSKTLNQHGKTASLRYSDLFHGAHWQLHTARIARSPVSISVGIL